jgi:hypothetical protein
VLPGINVPARGQVTAQRLTQLLPEGSIIRFVIEPSIGQYTYITDLRNRGFKVLLVVANESFNKADGGRYDYAELTKFINDNYGVLIWGIQVGNEWDHISGSSWTLNEADLDALLWTFWNAKHGGLDGKELKWTIVLGGSVSGNPERFMGLPDYDSYDMVAIHPYGQRPYDTWSPGRDWGFGNVVDLIWRYHNQVPNKPILLSEYGFRAESFGEDVQANYHVEMMAALHTLGNSVDWLVGYVPFAAHDEENYGILDRKAEQSIRTFLSHLYPTWVAERGEQIIMPQFQFQLGIAEKANQLGKEVVGEPIENEHETWFAGHKIQHQKTTTGEMIYWHQWNTVTFEKAR